MMSVLKVLILTLLAGLPALANSLRLHASVEESTCKQGTIPIFNLVVENTGRETVHFSYAEPTFWFPILVTGSGQQLTVQYPPYDGPARLVRVDLKPGARRALPASHFVVTAEADPTSRQAHLQAAPGKYRARYQIVLQGAGGQEWSLTSNDVLLKVTGP